MDLDQASSHNLRASSGPVSLLGRAASTFWKRALSESVDQGSDSLPSAYWWDTMLDNFLVNEQCDDVLESVLIPLGLVLCLFYLALRIHFLIVIRNYYVSLLREQMSYHLSRQVGLSHANERKYSTSSASSSTSASDFSSCLPSSSSKSGRFDTKVINEKMA
ncbi:hypothetical protein CBS101457_006247 [Exobasidium rhododendri]|nr:hypothetical protein CBS101457_006247 [Exobasidium rhododendri]